MCIFVIIGSIIDCYDITNNLIQSLHTSEGVTGLTDVVCAAHSSPGPSQYHYHLHLQSSQSDHHNNTAPLSDLLHPQHCWNPWSEWEEVLGNLNQQAADERVILVGAGAPTPQLFNITTRLIHRPTILIDPLLIPFYKHLIYRLSLPNLISVEKSQLCRH